VGTRSQALILLAGLATMAALATAGLDRRISEGWIDPPASTTARDEVIVSATGIARQIDGRTTAIFAGRDRTALLADPGDVLEEPLFVESLEEDAANLKPMRSGRRLVRVASPATAPAGSAAAHREYAEQADPRPRRI